MLGLDSWDRLICQGIKKRRSGVGPEIRPGNHSFFLEHGGREPRSGINEREIVGVEEKDGFEGGEEEGERFVLVAVDGGVLEGGEEYAFCV